MSTQVKISLLAATILALPSAAHAQAVTGAYVAAAAGPNWHQTTRSPIANTPALFGPLATVDFSQLSVGGIGWTGRASVGWGFGNGWRVELEGGALRNDPQVQGITYDRIGPRGTLRSGKINTNAVMANVLYDFSLGPLQPYVGAGIGNAWHTWDNLDVTIGGNDRVRFDGTNSSFAWQVMAGLSLPVAAIPGLALTAEYRYFATASSTFHGTYTVGSGPLYGTVASSSVRAENADQAILFGLRYNFNQARTASR